MPFHSSSFLRYIWPSQVHLYFPNPPPFNLVSIPRMTTQQLHLLLLTIIWTSSTFVLFPPPWCSLPSNMTWQHWRRGSFLHPGQVAGTLERQRGVGVCAWVESVEGRRAGRQAGRQLVWGEELFRRVAISLNLGLVFLSALGSQLFSQGRRGVEFLWVFELMV